MVSEFSDSRPATKTESANSITPTENATPRRPPSGNTEGKKKRRGEKRKKGREKKEKRNEPWFDQMRDGE